MYSWKCGKTYQYARLLHSHCKKYTYTYACLLCAQTFNLNDYRSAHYKRMHLNIVIRHKTYDYDLNDFMSTTPNNLPRDAKYQRNNFCGR